MRGFISHYSAAFIWGVPHLDILMIDEYVDQLRSGQIIDITIRDSGRRLKPDGYKVHSIGMDIPRGSVIKKGDLYVASPELTFLQLAKSLDMHRLILLGLQMCSHNPLKPHEAVTTKRKLEAFLKKTDRYHGHRKAIRALKYVEDGSGSIMESVLFMILTLPHSYGGYGLGGAYFNHEIQLDRDAQRQLKQRRCFVDLYYPKAKLAVEYDSFKHHKRASDQGKDSLRATILESQRIGVLRISTIEVYNKKSCETVAQNLSARLGKRIRINSKSFKATHDELRKLLPLYC